MNDVKTYCCRSTNVIFSAISATRFAIRDAMIVYGDICGGCASFTAPFVWGFFAALAVGFFVREVVVLLVVRFTGAEATEAAGILS